MNNKIILAAILDGYSRRKDGSCTIRFNTCELNTHQIAEVDTLYSKFGVLYFVDKERLEIPEINMLDELDTDIYDKPKTPSKRLYNVLYRVWEQSGMEGDFKNYYKTEMEKIINHYKSKLI